MKDMKAARCVSTAEELFRTATGAVVAAKFRIQDARIVLEIRRVLLQYRIYPFPARHVDQTRRAHIAASFAGANTGSVLAHMAIGAGQAGHGIAVLQPTWTSSPSRRTSAGAVNYVRMPQDR